MPDSSPQNVSSGFVCWPCIADDCAEKGCAKSRPDYKPHSEREPVITLRSAAEHLSSRLTLEPNPVELENAADLLLDLVEQLEAVTLDRDIAVQNFETGARVNQRLEEQYQAALAALRLWTACSPAHRAECAFLTERGCTCGLQRARETTIALVSNPASGYDGLVEAPKAASDVRHNREQNAECIGTPGCYYGAGMSSHSPACGASTPATCPDCKGFGMSDVETGEPSRVKTVSTEECLTCDGTGRVPSPATVPAIADMKCECGGCQRGEHHFDRSLCACGAMHYYCDECGFQCDDCDPATRPE